MYTTLGAPSGAFGASNGDQSGTESRMSTLMIPWNALLMLEGPRWLRTHHGVAAGAPVPSRRSQSPSGAASSLSGDHPIIGPPHRRTTERDKRWRRCSGGPRSPDAEDAGLELGVL